LQQTQRTWRQNAQNKATCVKARTERRIWTELNWHVRFSFWRTDQRASRVSSLVIGWRVRNRSHVNHRRRWTVPVALLLASTVGQLIKNRTISIQLGYVALYSPLRPLRWVGGTGPSRGRGSGGKQPRAPQRLGAPPSLKNIKYTRMHHLKNNSKFPPQWGSTGMFEGLGENVSPGPAVARGPEVASDGLSAPSYPRRAIRERRRRLLGWHVQRRRWIDFCHCRLRWGWPADRACSRSNWCRSTDCERWRRGMMTPFDAARRHRSSTRTNPRSACIISKNFTWKCFWI